MHARDLPGDPLDAPPEAASRQDDLLGAFRPGARRGGSIRSQHVGAEHQVLTTQGGIGVGVTTGQSILTGDHLLLVPVQDIHHLPHGRHRSRAPPRRRGWCRPQVHPGAGAWSMPVLRRAVNRPRQHQLLAPSGAAGTIRTAVAEENLPARNPLLTTRGGARAERGGVRCWGGAGLSNADGTELGDHRPGRGRDRERHRDQSSAHLRRPAERGPDRGGGGARRCRTRLR